MTSAVDIEDVGSPFDRQFIETVCWCYFQDCKNHLEYLNGDLPGVPQSMIADERKKVAASLTETLEWWIPVSGPH